jgi:putative hydrolase of the HAD superfamily
LLRAVIFDYGGVLTTSPFAGLEEWDAKLGIAEGTLRELLFGDYHAGESTGLVPRLERGELSIADFTVELMAQLPDRVDLGQVLGNNAFGVHWMVVARARALRDEGYKVGLLTNNIREYGDAWRATIPVEVFDDIVDSSEVGLRKPDPRIFRMAAERLETPPGECVFLDDLETNVEGARAVGMTGILVEDPWAALAELDRLLDGDERDIS